MGLTKTAVHLIYLLFQLNSNFRNRLKQMRHLVKLEVGRADDALLQELLKGGTALILQVDLGEGVSHGVNQLHIGSLKHDEMNNR